MNDPNNTGSVVVANAPADYAEVLDATVTNSSGSVTASGSVTNVAAGSSSPLAYTVDTGNAGTVTGTIDLSYGSDGTGLDGDGVTSDGTGAVTVSALVDNLATVVLSATSPGETLTQTGPNSYDLYLGAANLDGPTLMGNLSVLNGATGTADGLTGAWTVEPAGTIGDDVGFTNALSPLAAVEAGASVAQGFSLATATTGLQNEMLVFTPTSVNSSESPMPISPVTLTVDGLVGNMSPPSPPTPTLPGAPPPGVSPPAVVQPPPPAPPPSVPPAHPKITLGQIDVGTERVGEHVTKAETFTNTAGSGAGGLNATIDPNEIVGSIVATGSITNLGPGQTDSAAIKAGVLTDTAGVKNGSFQVDYTSSTSGLNTATNVVTFNSDPDEQSFPLTTTLFSGDTGQVSGTVTPGIFTPLAISGSITADASISATATFDAGDGSLGLSDPVSIKASTPSSVNTGKTFTVQTGINNNNNASLSPTLPTLSLSVTLNDSLVTSGDLNYYAPFSLTPTDVPLNYNVGNPVNILSFGTPSYSLNFPDPPGGSISASVPTSYDSTTVDQATGSTPPSPVAGLTEIVQNEVTTPILSINSPNFLDAFAPVAAANAAVNTAVELIPNSSASLASLNVSGSVVLASQSVFVPTELDVSLTPSWTGTATAAVPVGTAITLTAPDSAGSYTVSAAYSLTGTIVTKYGISANVGATFSLLGASFAGGTVKVGPAFTTGLVLNPLAGYQAYQYSPTPQTITATATGVMGSGSATQINPVYGITVVSPGAAPATGGDGSATSPATPPLDVIGVVGTVDQIAVPEISGGTDISSPPAQVDAAYPTNYVVNLGTTQVGSELGTNLSVLNAAETDLPADLLNGVWLVQSSDPVFSNSLGGADMIAAGQSGDVTGIQAVSGNKGTYSEVLSYTPASNNSSEAPLSLSNITVDVYGTWIKSPPPPPPPVPVPPVPPPPPPSKTSGGGGDPHLTTFNGTHFDFQTAGEFTLAQNADFTLQGRIEPSGGAASPSGVVSYIDALAFSLGANDRGTIDFTRAQPLWVDGTPVQLLPGQFITVGGVTVTATADSNGYSVAYATGETILATNGTVTVTVPDAVATNGVLGSNSDTPNDDFELPNGTGLGQSLTFGEEYNTYANAWRITQAQSLFNYAPGQSTATFTNTAFPPAPVNLSELPATLTQQAQAALAGQHFANTVQQQDAELDYILGGGSAQVASEDNNPALAGSDTQVVQSGPPPILYGINQSGTVTAVGTTAAAAQFEVYRTGSDVDTTVLNYTVVDTGDPQSVEAADYPGGVLPSGQVTLEAGSSIATFTILTPAGLRLPTEQMEVAISSPPAALLSYANIEATGTLEASSPIEGVDASPTLYLASGLGTLTGSGTSYLLNIGNVGADGAPPTRIGIENNAAGYADTLSGAVSENGPIQIGGSTFFTDVGGGGAADITVNASNTLGSETGKVVIDPSEHNSSGYQAVLPDITLTVLAYVTDPVATPSPLPGTIDVSGRIGGLLTPSITLGNDTTTPGSDNLSVTFTDVGGDLLAPGASGIAPGGTTTATLSDIAAAPGAFTDTLDVGYITYDPNDTSVGGALPGTTVVVDGTSYADAAPVLSGTTFDFGTVHQGDPAPTASVQVSNENPQGTDSDDLLADLGSIGPFSASGPVTVGPDSVGSLVATLATTAGGVFRSRRPIAEQFTRGFANPIRVEGGGRFKAWNALSAPLLPELHLQGICRQVWGRQREARITESMDRRAPGTRTRTSAVPIRVLSSSRVDGRAAPSRSRVMRGRGVRLRASRLRPSWRPGT